jgi:hypothetical protein
MSALMHFAIGAQLQRLPRARSVRGCCARQLWEPRLGPTSGKDPPGYSASRTGRGSAPRTPNGTGGPCATEGAIGAVVPAERVWMGRWRPPRRPSDAPPHELASGSDLGGAPPGRLAPARLAPARRRELRCA